MAKITVLIDEAQEGIPSGTSRLNPAHGALTIAKMGRDRGINMIVASQRIKTVDIVYGQIYPVYTYSDCQNWWILTRQHRLSGIKTSF